jgi:hypothetical protein
MGGMMMQDDAMKAQMSRMMENCNKMKPHETEPARRLKMLFLLEEDLLAVALPVFSAECQAMAGRAVAVPALLSISVVLPSAAYSFVLQSVTL